MRDGWKEISLEDLETSGVIKLGRGDVISKKDMEADPGPNPVYSSAENKNGMIGKYNKFMFDEELITWSVDGGGHIFYRPKHKFSVTNIGGWLRILDDKVFSYQFLTYALQRLHKQHSFDWQHKAHPSVIRKLYTRIPLPPLPEQKRIVDLISSVDSYIEALEQQLESAKGSRNAVLHELLTAGGDDWVAHKLIDIFEIYQPQTIAKSLMSGDGEFIVFGANGPIGRYHEFNHEEPEVVVTCRGATCGTINMTPPKTWITGNAMVVSPKTSEVSKGFLYWALIAGVDIQSVVSGSAQPQITREGLAPVKIKIPPLSRQKEIVDLISGFELNISHSEESLNKIKALRSGLLSDLLSGEHEIPVTYDKVMGAA